MPSHYELRGQKRQRNDSKDDQRTRSRYWFEDGNIILQAEDTLFRVHRSVLSLNSQIFKDMFALPQPSSQQDECIEGCSVVQVSDTAEDVSNLVSLLYDNQMVLKFRNKLSATVLGTMLRLGKKYLIAHFEREALDRLHHDYPTALKDWDAVCPIDDHRRVEDADEPLDSITEIISIAHEFSLFTILPAAYLVYLQHKNIEDLPNDDSIPKNAFAHCIIGKTRIVQYVNEQSVGALCPPLVIPSKSCSNSKCGVDKWMTIKNLPVWAIGKSRGLGIFEAWWLEGPDATENLCSRCRNAAKTLTEAVRSEFWSRLPTFFGLPDWTELESDNDE